MIKCKLTGAVGDERCMYPGNVTCTCAEVSISDVIVKRPARVKLRMKAWRGGASEKVVTR